jgi:PIN domain nuclease of toxin-antitoxin system
MQLLLDTHAWLWMLVCPRKLGPTTSATLASLDHQLYLSLGSIWETAIKVAAGRLHLPQSIDKVLDLTQSQLAVGLLMPTVNHVLEAARLPPHHRDPFDRLIVGQARIEGLTIVTADEAVCAYEVSVLRATS